ncbi:hypothetical protein [Insolitispirillum peregrinum]|uniref:hypothetical protein n=1 Tax=Insolitispirillum peregrinum TaxID=80876 RepID=UPI0011156676|nr:hypothetical protein [Insolitispirillum peregrinum]
MATAGAVNRNFSKKSFFLSTCAGVGLILCRSPSFHAAFAGVTGGNFPSRGGVNDGFDCQKSQREV